MPHAGGGGSGGFHYSGGGGSRDFHYSGGGGSHSSARYDHHGHMHSTYYIHPGFYYNSCYIPASRKHRLFNMFFPKVIGIIASIGICLGFGFLFCFDTDTQVEDFAFESYDRVYSESSKSYEYNVCLSFLTYDNGTNYDYFPAVGDEIDSKIDFIFGDKESLFGKALLNNIPEHYSEDFYVGLAASLNQVNDSIVISTPYYSQNSLSNSLINESSYSFSNGEEELKKSMDVFKEKTGYCISFVIGNETSVLKPNYWAIVIASGVAIALTAFIVTAIIKEAKAYKSFKKEEEKGNEGKFFEGEDSYDEYKATLDRIDKKH